MSALSSATSTRAGGPEIEAGVTVPANAVVSSDISDASDGASLGSQRSASCTYGSALTEPARPSPARAERVGGQVRSAERQADGEGGARAFGAVGGDGAAVQPHQLLHQGQPDTAALVGSRSGGLDAVEPLEQPRHLRGRHPDAGVGDGDHGVGVLTCDPHGDGAVEGELQGVGQQVEDHLLPHVAVEVDGFVQRRAVHDRGSGPHGRRPSGRRWPARR